METTLKLVGTLIVLTIILVTSFNLVNTFNHYTSIKVLASDLENLNLVMKSLKETSSQGSWQQVNLLIPKGYTLFFNNETENLEVIGEEEFNISVNNDLLYEVNLSAGAHQLQLYYGQLSFNDLKNETLVFK